MTQGKPDADLLIKDPRQKNSPPIGIAVLGMLGLFVMPPVITVIMAGIGTPRFIPVMIVVIPVMMMAGGKEDDSDCRKQG